MLADKQFLLWIIPLAFVAFVAGPLAVLHGFHPLEHLDDGIEIYAKMDAAQLPDTIPLMLQTEQYSETGHQTLEVDDQRLMNLTSFVQMVSLSTDDKPIQAFLGYMPIARTFRQKKEFNSYPVGDLLLVTKVSFSGFDDEEEELEHLILETQQIRHFRLKSVEVDELSGLLFGRVEW